jgi:glycosyltransferase involved in cell wall biosynthesis
MHSVKYVFIHRETAPFGPPIFEWIIAKILHKKIIYDFDDAIWLTDKKNESRIEHYLRHRSKVSRICKWSYKTSCGNSYLADYAKKFSQRVIINATTIDTMKLHNPELYPEISSPKRIVIGWTGSHSTLKYIDSIVPVIQKLQAAYSFVDFLVIANRKPDLNILRMEFIEWKKGTEAEDLLKIDIGIMPLPDDDWSRGKCGFKALQYMAMKKPCVASPVGVNLEIIEHGINGFLAESPEEWYNHLENLVCDKNLRQRVGEAGRKKIIENYSVASNTSTFLSLFE